MNPIWTYVNNGTYTVSLNVTNGRYNTTIRNKYINVLPQPPVANFSVTPLMGNYPLIVRFTNLSTGCQTAWNWSLGDGTFNNSVNPIKTYSTWGNYTVSLNVSNRGGYNIMTNTGDIVVKPLPPIANFRVNVTSGMVPLPVQFNDTSTRNATAWNWSFGDGNYSTIRNATYIYPVNGKFNVSLNASNLGGSNVYSQLTNITVLPQPPITSFTSNVTTGKAPLIVQFNDTSTGVMGTWSWNFGDGGTSTSQNPVYQYNQIGNYTVTLNTVNAGGSNTSTNYITVTLGTPVVNFAATPTTGTAPLTVEFNDRSDPGYTTSTEYAYGTPTAKAVYQSQIPDYAFDHNGGTYWEDASGMPSWIQMDYGAGNAHVINHYYVTGNLYGPSGPTDWTFLGSNDGITWTTLDARSGVVWTGALQTKSFGISNLDPYRFYRL